jgi:hypothetical protein
VLVHDDDDEQQGWKLEYKDGYSAWRTTSSLIRRRVSDISDITNKGISPAYQKRATVFLVSATTLLRAQTFSYQCSHYS